MGEKILTTLCYLEKDGAYLVMHRTKKENDINRDKYIGLGGHIERGESPEDCIIREIKEESGLTVSRVSLRGILSFVIDDYDEYSFLYTCSDFSGELRSCDEGELVWVDKSEIDKLPIWEGDRIFFRLLNDRKDVFSLKLVYVHDRLTGAYLDGEKIS